MSHHRKIRMGMIGGGKGAFIGAVHRIAAAIDQQVELVCGAFSSNPETSFTTGKELFLPEGYLEAFANTYLNFSEHIRDRLNNEDKEYYDYASIDDGIRGMAFIEATVASSKNNAKWTTLK